MRSRSSRRYAIAAAASCLLHSLAIASGESLAGLSLEDAIGVFERDGLRVFYSSDLVRPGMTVTAEPESEDRAEALAEILLPHGLMLRPGFDDVWLVVRDPRPAREPEPAAAAAPRFAPAPAEPYIPKAVEDLVVLGSRYEIRRASTVSSTVISERQLEYLPDLGEDAIRAVARLPGMASTGIGALANVRGGEINETLVRIDGLRLYDPFHLKDFQSVFSVIDPRIVSAMDVYTGGYPAAYGDRMSGVIDVETIAPSKPLYHEIGVSFFNSSILSAGRFADRRGEWVVSARRSNLDVLYDQFSEQPERPRYTDMFAKLGFEVNDRLRITGNLLRADDDIVLADDVDREERASAEQLDEYAWIRLDHRLGGKTDGTTLVARARVDGVRSGTSEKDGVSTGSLLDIRSFSWDTVQSEWSRLLGARAVLEFGGSLTRMRGAYDYREAVELDLLFDIDGASTETSRSRSLTARPSGRRQALFATLRFDFNPRFATEAGLRWNRQTIDAQREATLAPRLALKYDVTERTTLRASWGRFFQSQAVNELQINDGVEIIFPSQRAEHRILGVDRLLAGGAMLRAEVYEKSMHGLRPRFENLLNTRVLLPELKPDRVRIAPERARARGLELSLEGQAGMFQWWGALSWARVTDRIERDDVPRSWDQPFALSAGLSWERSAWHVSAAVTYRSGWPTTPVALDEEAAFPTAAVGVRNSERMGAFGGLDLRVSRDIRLDRSVLAVSLELTNLTGRSNPCCYEYEIGDEEDAGRLVLDELNYLPTIPSIGMLWQF